MNKLCTDYCDDLTCTGRYARDVGGSGYKAHEDLSFVEGESPAIIDVENDLGRRAVDGEITNDGSGDILVEISENGTDYGDVFRIKNGETRPFTGWCCGISKIRLTWVTDSSYRIFVK